MDKKNSVNVSNGTMESFSPATFIFYIVLIIVIVYLILYLTGWKIYSFIKYGMRISIALIALSLLFMVFKRLVPSSGWGGLIVKTLFYIPCTFTNAIQYLIKDFTSTTSETMNLLFVETVLILIYFFAFPLIQSSIYNNGVVLLSNPVPLNKLTRIDRELYNTKSHKRPDPITNKIDNDSPIRQTYALSMWVYLNIQPFTQLSYLNESTIFSYSYANGSGHPRITYKNNTQGADSYVFYLSPSTKYTASLPHQKWNNIVFNYRDGYVDLFINTVLESTIQLIDTPIYTNTDTITVGEKSSERNGLYGAICNVCYYKNILTEGQIIDNYNLLSVMNPPVY